MYKYVPMISKLTCVRGVATRDVTVCDMWGFLHHYIHTQGQLIAAPGLDYETTPTYTLGVAAIDQSSDPRDRQTSICTVQIQLRDTNDNAPIFDSILYEATIIENATIGTNVTVVSARDIDSGINAEIFYLFQSPISKWSELCWYSN